MPPKLIVPVIKQELILAYPNSKSKDKCPIKCLMDVSFQHFNLGEREAILVRKLDHLATSLKKAPLLISRRGF